MFELLSGKSKKQQGLTFDITEAEEQNKQFASQAEQLAAALAKSNTANKDKNPYAFWKTPIIKGKEGREGLTLDKAVAMAGMLAESINPPEVYPYTSFGGRLGRQMARWATEGGKAYEDWETQQRTMGLEERKIAAEEQRIAKPTETEILSGLGGPAAREQFITGQQAMRAPHPTEIALSQARVDVERETQQLKRKELELVPEEFKMRQAEHKSRLATLDLEKRRIDLEIEKLGLEKQMLGRGETKETIQGVKSVNQSFDQFVQAWMTKHVYTTDDEKSNFLKNAELAASVQSHIAGIRTFTDNPIATEKSIRYWFSQVDKEMNRPSKVFTRARALGATVPFTGEKLLEGFEEVSRKEAAEQAARRRYYIKSASEMLQASESQSSDLYETLIIWAMKAGYSDQDVTNLLSSFGFNAKQQTAIINKAATRFKP